MLCEMVEKVTDLWLSVQGKGMAGMGCSKVDKQGRCSSFVGIANAQHVERNLVHEESVCGWSMVGQIVYLISEIWQGHGLLWQK